MKKYTQPFAAGETFYSSILSAYQSLQNHSPITLKTGFESETFHFKDFSAGFAPHLQSDELITLAESFGQSYDIWLSNARQYISCCLYLFPDGPVERMIPIVQNCAIDFYLHDVMGREMFPHLSSYEQARAASIIKRISKYHPAGMRKVGEMVEIANAGMIKQFHELSPLKWFENFLSLYNKHIDMAHRDPLPDGTCPALEDYFEARLHISGMPHTIALLEFANNNFLNWDELEKISLNKLFERLNEVVGLIGCLMNDLFSFEKEVIDNASFSNLVAVLFFLNEQEGLREACMKAVDIVRDLLKEFSQISHQLTVLISNEERISAETVNSCRQYLNSISKVVIASWVWQCATKRYKRVESIFTECHL